MKFKSIDELVRYIVNEPINLEFTDIEFKSDGSEKVEKEDKKEVKENIDIKLITFFDNPSIMGKIGNENIMFVESVEGTKNFCGAGKISFMGREVMINLCESDGSAYIKLSLDIDGKILENVCFKLEASDVSTRNTLQLRNDILDG